MFYKFRQADLILGPKKYSFSKDECVFLVHLISRDGIRPPSDRVKTVEDYPILTSAKELFFELLNWFRKFIPNFNAISKPLCELLRKGTSFTWAIKHTKCVIELKHRILHSEV